MCNDTNEIGIRVSRHQTFTHAAAVELLNAVTEGMLYYLSTFNDPDSERLGNALRLATDLVFETLPSGHTDVWT